MSCRKHTLWGGRFEDAVDHQALAFSSSIGFDCRLAEYDLRASLAQVKMLARCQIIPDSEAEVISKGLEDLLAQVKAGRYKPRPESEDIHTDIQNKLRNKIGMVADKLNTARSRNDQVSVDTRMYCKDRIRTISKDIVNLQSAILSLAEANFKVIMPGFTHLQHAQPILLAHYLIAYIEMFQRDKERLADVYKRVDVLPLGSCALAGTSLPIDRSFLANELGFSKVSDNSLDAVSDRDFVIEILSCLSIIAMHLSRLSEDLIIMNSPEFSFIDIDQAFCTGSSIMPQKKNPDILELIRGGAGRVYGDLNSVLVTMKGVPLAYNRDMQWDKLPLFNSLDFVGQALTVLARLFGRMKVNSARLAEVAADEFMMATDLAEYLVKKGVAFRRAHEIVGWVVKYCLEEVKKMKDLSLEEWRSFCPCFDQNIFRLLEAKVSVENKLSYGATAPAQVRKQLIKWKKRLLGSNNK